MNKRANKAYPVEKIDKAERYPRWKAEEAKPGTTWHRMLGIQTSSFCVIRYRDPDTQEILNRPTLAAGPLASMADAEALVTKYEEHGEPE